MSDDNIITMEITKAMHFVCKLCEMQLKNKYMPPPYIVGTPGIGKTQILKEIAKEYGFEVVSFHFALMSIEEVTGIPIFKKIFDFPKNLIKRLFNESSNDLIEITGTEWSIPAMITKIYETAKNNEKVIVLLDDFHLCPPDILKLGYEMFTERKMNDYHFPDNVAFVLTGNDSIKSGAKQMFAAIVNRMGRFKVVPDFDKWEKTYAISNNVNPKVLSFLKNEINSKYFNEEESTNEPWSSPRSWTYVSYILNEFEKYKLSIDDIHWLVSGYISRKAASEFIAFYEIYSKVEMDKVFNDEKEIKIPDNFSDIYIYSIAAMNEYINRIMKFNNSTLNSNIKSKKIKSTLNKFIEILLKISVNSVEITIAIIKNLNDYSKSLNKNFYINEMLMELKNDPEINNNLTKILNDIHQTLAN